MAADEISLTIEQTNALRLKLGLKPLRVSASDVASSNAGDSNRDGARLDAPTTSDAQDRQAVENLRKRRAEDEARRHDAAALERLGEARTRIERDRKLGGRTLGDADADDGGDAAGEGTMSWVKRLKKTPRVIAPATESAATQTPAAAIYSSAELEGLKVRHDLADIETGQDVILTLDDADVLDEGGPELVNAALVAQDKLRQKLDKQRKPTALDNFDRAGTGELLSKYDDADGSVKKPEGFTISSRPAAVQARRSRLAYDDDDEERVGISLLDEDAREPVLQSDYRDDKPVKIRKRVRKIDGGGGGRARVAEDFSDIAAVKTKPIVLEEMPRPTLAVPAVRPQDESAPSAIAEAIRREKLLAKHDMQIDEPEGGLVIDDASAFASALQRIEAPAPAPIARAEEVPRLPQPDVPMHDAAEQMTSPAAQAEPQEKTGAIFEEEKTMDKGLGVAMELLRGKGALDSAEGEDAAGRQEREAWLAKDKRIRLEVELERGRVRERLRSDAKVKAMTNRQREEWLARETRRVDEMEAEAARERFKDYVPRVELAYKDAFGRKLDTKEAWKHMSQQFHGKYSGAGKTAKKLARVEKEREQERERIFR